MQEGKPIDRVNKSIFNNIRLTYKCHTLLETSGDGVPIYQHIMLILGGYLTPHTYRVNILMTKPIIFSKTAKASQILMKFSQMLQRDVVSNITKANHTMLS